MFLRTILFTCFIVYGYASTSFDLTAAMSSGDIDKIKLFCKNFDAGFTSMSLSAEEKKKAGFVKDTLCTDAYLDSVQEVAPLVKCSQQAAIKLELTTTCGSIDAETSCSDLGKWSKCQDGILTKRCDNVPNVAALIAKSNEATFSQSQKGECMKEVAAAASGKK
ncbi:unnamed protein product, partial [Mesorhabditis belari]|uniref:Uncharacterized protein n=1 Tax=Mesorhabditis belari TaxID=2138241 RepID=A0AAF3ETV4_9BILA